MARAGATAGLEAADIAFIRFAVTGPIMLPWMLRHALGNLGEVGWPRGARLTLLVGPGFILLGVGGYRFAPLAHGAVFQPAALTLGGMALAVLLLGDRIAIARIVGAGVIIAGPAAIAAPRSSTRTDRHPSAMRRSRRPVRCGRSSPR